VASVSHEMAVVALGGNALLRRGEPLEAARRSRREIEDKCLLFLVGIQPVALGVAMAVPPGVGYERYAVPGPGRVLFQAALANFNPRAATSVDFHNDDRAPLLFIAGGKEHVSPAALNESNARRYLKSKAVTVYEEFPLRPHFTLGEEGWELVADYALTWAIENAGVCLVRR
jgi:pimeloyl-ACP methyl ester carboxylesterase